MADAVQFLGAPTKKAVEPEPSDEPDEPADKPAGGAYRRSKAS